MRIAIRFILLTIVVHSFAVLADDTVTVDYLKQNTDQIDNKIFKVEDLLLSPIKGEDRELIEKLKINLVTLKRHHLDLKKVSSIDDGIVLSKANGWPNALVFLQKLKSTCSPNPTDECFLAISEFEKFVASRKISDADKDKLYFVSNNYSVYNEARAVINESFVSTTNKLLKKAAPLLNMPEKPLATVTIHPTAVSIPKIIVKKVELPPQAFKFSEKMIGMIKITVGGILFSILGLFFFYKMKKKREIKKFYSVLFYVIKKNQISAKLFGKITVSNVRVFRKVEKSYFDLLISSGALKSNLDIRIKTKNKRMTMETVIHADRPIQDLVNQENSGRLKDQFLAMEKKLSSHGGELKFINAFNDEGKLISTSFSFTI